MKYKVEDLLKVGVDMSREELIELAKDEIKKWQEFLADLEET